MTPFSRALWRGFLGAVVISAVSAGAALAAISSTSSLAASGEAVAQLNAPVQVQYYYPPPGYYVPAPAPPAYAPPPPQDRDLNRAYDPERDGPLGYPTQRGQVPYGYMCYAGVYVCQLPAAGPVGSGCSCPGWGAPSYGTIR